MRGGGAGDPAMAQGLPGMSLGLTVQSTKSWRSYGEGTKERKNPLRPCAHQKDQEVLMTVPLSICPSVQSPRGTTSSIGSVPYQQPVTVTHTVTYTVTHTVAHTDTSMWNGDIEGSQCQTQHTLQTV